jgi:hypothetical protein
MVAQQLSSRRKRTPIVQRQRCVQMLSINGTLRKRNTVKRRRLRYKKPKIAVYILQGEREARKRHHTRQDTGEEVRSSKNIPKEWTDQR